MSWLLSSFRVQNGGIKRRRSSRVEKMTPNRAAKAKAMIVACQYRGLVLNLWLSGEE
jgi:hypothetical protein